MSYDDVSAEIDEKVFAGAGLRSVTLNPLLKKIAALAPYGPSVAAYLIAMEAAQPGAAALVEASVPADPSGPNGNIYILFNRSPNVVPDGLLETFFGQVTGLSMPTIRLAAAQVQL